MKILKKILFILIALAIAITIINCQRNQRRSTGEPMTTAEHREVYYQYLAYMEGRE